MKQCIDLSDKTILVVGAAGRIGQTVVGALLEAGANVTAVDSNSQSLIELQKQFGQQQRVQYEVVDITKPGVVAHVLQIAENRFGSVDGAVNTAYPRNANYGRKFFEVTYEDFSENISLHLGGYFVFMQQCAKFALARKQKFSLVNLSSIYGSMTPKFDVYAGTEMTMPVEYAAIKAGLNQITRYVNAYTKSIFRANCVSPGGILSGQDDKFLKQYQERCMTKGMLDSADVVGTILFLLSDASEYVVSQNLIVDDGFSV